MCLTALLSGFNAPHSEPVVPVTGLSFGSLFSGSGGDGSLKACRRRKARTVFSDQQLTGLEKRFAAQRYLSTPERVELANALHLSETQVITGIVNMLLILYIYVIYVYLSNCSTYFNVERTMQVQ